VRTAFPIAVLALAFAACPTPPPPPPDGGNAPECESRAECEVGLICSADGVCAGCVSSGQCRLKELCGAATLRCELRPSWGDDCVINDNCPAGSWCVQGLCLDRSEVCEEDLGCLENADCGAGEVCNVGSHACVPRCTVDTQDQVCQSGERCVDERCVQCASDAECGVGLVCDAAGRCSSAERCYTDRDCRVPLVCHLPTGACLAKQPPCVSDENCAPDLRCHVGTGKCVPRGCQLDPYEPNDSLEAAYGVSASAYFGLTLCEGDVDYYFLNLNRGDQLGVNVDADPFAEHTFSTVVKDGTGRTLAAGRLLTSYVATASARYYVVISTTDPYQPYDVRFLLSRGTPCDDDAYEPNDQPSQATLVNAASSLEGAICPQDQDHFAVSVPSGKGVRVSLVNYDPGLGLLRACLFEGASELGCSDEAAPVLSASSSQVGGKSVIARVLGSTERVANSYTLKVEFL
jgi:Cys-rich repeat protein